MLIVNSNVLLGDALAALPAIWAKAQNEKVFLVSNHKEVATLLPKHPNIVHILSNKDFFDTGFEHEGTIRHLSAATNFQMYCVNYVHMAQGYYTFLDMPYPPEVPTCPLDVELKEPTLFNTSFDFLISAGSRSDYKNNKLWPYERWQEIINWLRAGGYTVAALTSGRGDEHYFKDLDGGGNGLPLKEVGGAYIKKVKKAVISIDNGISHFTRMLGAPHILLYPACLPISWVNNPNTNCFSIHREPMDLSVDEVKSLIGMFLAQNGSWA